MSPEGQIALALIFIFSVVFVVSHLADIAKELKRIADAAEKINDLYCQKEGINRFK